MLMPNVYLSKWYLMLIRILTLNTICVLLIHNHIYNAYCLFGINAFQRNYQVEFLKQFASKMYTDCIIQSESL